MDPVVSDMSCAYPDIWCWDVLCYLEGMSKYTEDQVRMTVPLIGKLG